MVCSVQSFAESALCLHSFENTAGPIGHHDYILRPTNTGGTDNRKEFILSSRFCKALYLIPDHCDKAEKDRCHFPQAGVDMD